MHIELNFWSIYIFFVRALTRLAGRRVYAFGGYKLEGEELYAPRVEYYHTKKKRWFSTFSLATFDKEIFREVDAHLLQVPNANPNFRVLTTAYKYPLW